MVVATSMRHTKALRKLLPPGQALPTGLDTVLMKVLEGLSGELSRLEQRGCDLLDEVDPRTTTELIGDWERVLGLPSDCGPPPTDLVERRAAVVARLINNNPSTLETLRLIAEAWGVPATIRPRRPIQLGLWQLGEGHELGPPETRFVTTVEFGFEPVKLFRVGTSRVGESLASVNRPEGAICALEDAAPAHTKLTFTFTGPDAVSVYVLRIDRSGTGVWTIELDSGGCVPIRVGRAGGLDIPVVGGTLQVFQRGAGVVGIHLTPLGSGWTFNVTPRAGGSWSVDVGPAALQFNGGATSVLKACPIDNQIPVTLRNGSTLQAALEEL